MPLHDWSKLPEWEGVHQLWIAELFYDIRSKLPPGFRAGLGTVPSLTIGSAATKPDVSVHHATDADARTAAEVSSTAAQFGFEEEVNLLTLEPSVVVQVYRQRDLVAVLELISPSNKDRESTRITTRDRIIGYLMLGVQLAYVDVHARPYEFSLADFVAQGLELSRPPFPSPHALAYRVGPPPDKQGRSLAVSRVPLKVGQALPALGLPISREIIVPVDLDATYSKAAGSYLSWLPATNGTGAMT